MEVAAENSTNIIEILAENKKHGSPLSELLSRVKAVHNKWVG